MSEEQLNTMAIMSINKNFILNIDSFDRKVIEHFTLLKVRRLDLKKRNLFYMPTKNISFFFCLAINSSP